MLAGITEKRSPIANKKKKLFWINLFQSFQREINFGEGRKEVRRERYKKYYISISILLFKGLPLFGFLIF